MRRLGAWKLLLVRWLVFAWAQIVASVETESWKPLCEPSFKFVNGSCVSLTNLDVLQSLHWLAQPITVPCKQKAVSQDLAVCEELIDVKQCIVWSFIASDWCDHYGSLEFELYWAQKGCKVTLFHFISAFKGNVCALPPGPHPDSPNLNIVRYDLWGERCFACLYRYINPLFNAVTKVDVLKIQARAGVHEDLDGVQYTVLSDLYSYIGKAVTDKVQQIVFLTTVNSRTLTDSVGRESEHAFNFHSTYSLLFGGYVNTYAVPQQGPARYLPLQFDHLLDQVELDPHLGQYAVSYARDVDATRLKQRQQQMNNYQPKPPKKLTISVPGYCKVPSVAQQEEMERWALEEIEVRCHATRLAVPCRRRPYESFTPCKEEALSKLAEDYANSKGWCDFSHPAARIPALKLVPAEAERAFAQVLSTPSTYGSGGSKKPARLAFFFTVYTDFAHLQRMFRHLYSPQHVYLIHVDASPGASSVEFVSAVQQMAANYNKDIPGGGNVFVVQEVSIVYGAATATVLLVRAMAWFLEHVPRWDYLVCVTGSDYPLVPLRKLESMLTHLDPPSPWVMAWTPGTSTHIFRLQKTHPVFEAHPLLVKSVDAVTLERGKLLGAVPMEYRSGNFGPFVSCNARASYVHLDNRFNKSQSLAKELGRTKDAELAAQLRGTSAWHDTQWLFPRDTFPNRGRAYAEENRAFAKLPIDGEWRVWKKSDPATTGVYDRASVEYIIQSVEGKKYFHFFKHMLLGSEEHMFVSLLYNWPRTRSFVQTLTSQSVWNTWELGLWEQAGGGFLTHTHFLTMQEWDILRGFSLRGMLFARKFNSKKTAHVLDQIDSQILFNSSFDSAGFWPGWYDTDVYSSGKFWIAAYKKQSSVRNAAVRSGEYMLPRGNVYMHPDGSYKFSNGTVLQRAAQTLTTGAVDGRDSLPLRERDVSKTPSAGGSGGQAGFHNINTQVRGTSTRKQRRSKRPVETE